MEKYLQLFLEYLQTRNFTDTTISDYRTRLIRFFYYLRTELNINDLSKVTREITVGYQRYLFTLVSPRYGKTLSMKTQGAYLSNLKSFFKFLVRHDYVLYDPTTLIELPKREKYLPRVILTKKEMNALLNQPDIATISGYRDRTILEIFYSTGIRSKELISLNITDVDTHKGKIFVRQGKGSKDRVVPLTDTAAEFTEGYILNIRRKLTRGSHTEALILRNSGLRADKQNVLRMIRRYAVKAKIKKTISCHTFRHTCATHLLANGANIRYIQELLGHKSLETTQIYTKVEITDLKKVHKKYHPRERF